MIVELDDNEAVIAMVDSNLQREQRASGSLYAQTEYGSKQCI